MDTWSAQRTRRSYPSVSECSSIGCSFTDGSHAERSNRPARVSLFSRSEETALGRCLVVSFVFCRERGRSECGNCAQVYRARTGRRKNDGRDVLFIFSLFGTWTCKGIDPGLLVIGPSQCSKHIG